MNRDDTARIPESKDIIRDYSKKGTLTLQDVVRCYLSLFSVEVSPTYDTRVHLWDVRPGDAVYVNGVFVPVLSRFAIDDGDRHWRCVHVRDQQNRLRKCDLACRKWYACYKKENGRVGVLYPDFDGLTTIRKDDLIRTIMRLKRHDRRKMVTHFAVIKNDEAMLKQVRKPKGEVIDKERDNKGLYKHRRKRRLIETPSPPS